MSLFLNLIEPSVGSYNLTITLPKVDLPQPDSPTSPNVSPLYILKLTSSTAVKYALSFLKKPFLFVVKL